MRAAVLSSQNNKIDILRLKSNGGAISVFMSENRFSLSFVFYFLVLVAF
jgi:hypothetical protein